MRNPIRSELIAAATCGTINITRMKQQFVVTHVVFQTEISCITGQLGYKNICQSAVSRKNRFSLRFRKT
jgi:hypothetical protein